MKNLHLYHEASLCWLGECDPKPVLRPLQDITKEELIEMINLIDPKGKNGFSKEEFDFNVDQTLKNIKINGFDEFELSELPIYDFFQLTAFFLSKGFNLGLLEPGTYILKS